MASARKTGRFARSDRLLDGRDFQRVLRHGRRRSSRELVVVSLPRDRDPLFPTGGLDSALGGSSRLGITTGRKAGNAVYRNRFRRRVRAWFRANRGEINPNLDLVVIARRPGTLLGYSELDDRLSRMLDLSPIKREARS
jgi:ribonuclease P protein component